MPCYNLYAWLAGPESTRARFLGRLAQFFAEQVIGRTVRITERRGALAVMQPVPEHVAHGGQDVGDTADIFVVPEQHLSVARDAEMVKMRALSPFCKVL